jgi:hypothetical protein
MAKQLKRVAMAEARASLSDLADDIRKRRQRVKLTRYGRTMLYLVPPEDGRLLDECGQHLEECCRRLRTRKA